jgi:hypothetical protein
MLGTSRIRAAARTGDGASVLRTPRSSLWQHGPMPRGEFQVDTIGGPRWELALSLLEEGKAVTLCGLTVQLTSNSPLVIRVQSTWRPEETTQTSAREDLRRAEAAFKQLSQVTPQLQALVASSRLRFELEYDYGMGALLLCTLEGDRLHWAPGFPKSQ